MNELVTSGTAGTAIIAVGMGALAPLPVDYPVGRSSYDVLQPQGSYGQMHVVLTPSQGENDRFARQVKSIYANLERRQEDLGPEFEAAIFGNLEDLYEE